MKSNIKVDTEVLNDVVLKQEKLNLEMKEVFEKVKNDMKVLKDYWDTNTSSHVFTDFEKLYKIFEQMNSFNDKEVVFLKNVIANYTDIDSNISKLIDEKLTVN